MTTRNEHSGRHMKDLYGVGGEVGGWLMQRAGLEWATAQEARIFVRYQFIDGISIGSGPAGFQWPEAKLWKCCCSVRTWYDRDDPAPGGFCYGGACKCVDIMLSSHISIVSHGALFRFLWCRLFCFVLPCCVILCFGGIKAPWGGFIPPKGVVLTRGGGFIPHKGWLYPPKGVVVSPKRGGFGPP